MDLEVGRGAGSGGRDTGAEVLRGPWAPGGSNPSNGFQGSRRGWPSFQEAGGAVSWLQLVGRVGVGMPPSQPPQTQLTKRPPSNPVGIGCSHGLVPHEGGVEDGPWGDLVFPPCVFGGDLGLPSGAAEALLLGNLLLKLSEAPARPSAHPQPWVAVTVEPAQPPGPQ